MLKILVVAKDIIAGEELVKKMTQIVGVVTARKISILTPSDFLTQKEHEFDLVITDQNLMSELLLNKHKAMQPRKHIKASTHQGIVMVPMHDINYFQAEHKYVVVYHAKGQLLIEDSLNSLANEFAETFVRIHRKTLVAKHKIQILNKDDKGKFFIKLRDSDEKLMVSRRQLAQVRKILSCL